jgi:hypothetical protein
MKIDQLVHPKRKIHDENKSLQGTAPCIAVAATAISSTPTTINKMPPLELISFMTHTSKGGVNEEGGAFVTIDGTMIFKEP